jgi:hypothetical protein
MKRAFVLLAGAGLAFGLAALASSAPSQAASRDLMSCRGSRGQTIDCCEHVQRKPLWFRTSDLSCHDVVTCAPKDGKPWCYVKIVKEDKPNDPKDPPEPKPPGNGGDNPDTSVPK